MDKLSLKDRIEVILRSEEHDYDNSSEISLRQIIQAILNGKKIIAAVVIASLILAMVGNYINTPYKGVAKIMISLNFDGIEKGLDPAGQKFDIAKIKAPIVTSKVIQALNLDKNNISADDLRQNITLQPVVPGDIVNKIANLKESVTKGKENVQTLENFVYYPTDYIISLSIPKKMNLSNAKAQEVLDQIVNSYSEYFYETYGDKSALANAVGKVDYSTYDYPEVSVIMNNQINILDSYLSKKVREAKDFRSTKTGLTFLDIQESVNVINQVDINKLDSIIANFRLTKNKANLISYYEYSIKKLELSKTKKEDEARVASDLLSKFQKDKNIVIVPGTSTSTDSTIETAAPNPMYDNLTQTVLDAGVAASNTSRDIEYYRNQIALYQAEDLIPADQKVMAEKEVNTLIDSITTKLDNWIALTNDTVSEYFETQYFNNAIVKLSPAEMTSANSNRTLYLAIALVIGLLLGIFAALFLEYWKNGLGTIQKKTEEA